MAGAGYKLFNTGDVLTAAQVNTYLQEQVVMVFADATARTTALSGVLAEGMVSYLKDTNATEVYDGSAWVGIGNAGDITGVTAGTGISGGGTSGTVTITNDMATTITAAGDIVVGTGSGTYDNLPIGTTGQVLTADTTVSPYKVKWASAAGGTTFVGCFAYRTTTLSVSNNTTTSIPFDSEIFDTNGFHSTSSNTDRFTIPTGYAGKYLVNARITWAGNSTGYREIRVHKFTPSESNVYIGTEYPGNSNNYDQKLTFITNTLNVGDYLSLKCEQTSGGNLNVNGNAVEWAVYFEMIWLGA